MTKEVKLSDYKNQRYLALKRIVGEEMARYCLCAVFNVAYDPDIECVSFEDYTIQLGDLKFREGQIHRFSEVDSESDEQMEEWIRTWGKGDSAKPYTADDYKQLDAKFEVYSARLEKSGGMDEQQEDTLRTCSRMRLESDKYFVRGGKDNIAMASQLNKMVQDMLASEQLRKKDEKPITTARFDGIVEIMSRKYGAEVEMDEEKAKEVIAEWMVSHKYPMTMDAAEHCYLAMLNNARMNDDLPELAELPKEMQIPKELEYEFEEKQNQEEKEAYDYLKIKNYNKPTI